LSDAGFIVPVIKSSAWGTTTGDGELFTGGGEGLETSGELIEMEIKLDFPITIPTLMATISPRTMRMMVLVTN
jgi:hypothetical protein